MTAHSIHIQQQKQHLFFSANTLVTHRQPLQLPGYCCSTSSLCQAGICPLAQSHWVPQLWRVLSIQGENPRCWPDFADTQRFSGFTPQGTETRIIFPGLCFFLASLGFGGFVASLLFGTSFGGLIVATAVTQARGLALLIMSGGSSTTYSRTYCSWWQASAQPAPRLVCQGRVSTCLCKCKAPWAQRHESSYSTAEELCGCAGIQTAQASSSQKAPLPNTYKLQLQQPVSSHLRLCWKQYAPRLASVYRRASASA